MTTKPFILAGFAMLFISVSCNSDDAPTPAPIVDNSNAVFDRYTVDQTSTGTNPEHTFRTFKTANLLDGKLFSETEEQFIDGVSQGEFTNQRYFYENDRLVKRAYDEDVRDFFYDTQGRLIAVNWQYGMTTNLFYRFVYVTSDKVYFEKLTLAYDDPATQVRERFILEFDANDNVIKAGVDNDFDGEYNGYNTFDYNAANNLTTVHKSDGTTVDINYSIIKDNFAKLAVNTFGKKNLMVYQAECYVFASNRPQDLRQSPNLRDTDTQEALIETQGFPYYFRKTQTLTSEDSQTTIVTTFYFE
jgi:hypothetical protein